MVAIRIHPETIPGTSKQPPAKPEALLALQGLSSFRLSGNYLGGCLLQKKASGHSLQCVPQLED